MNIPDLSEFPNVFRRFTGVALRDVAHRLDEILGEEPIPLHERNVDQLPQTGFIASRMSIGPATQAAIGGIEAAFRNPGVSIAICGEDHSYQNPSASIKLLKGFMKTGMTFEEAAEMFAEQQGWDNPNAVLSLKQRTNKAFFEKDVASYPGSVQDQARTQQLLLLARGGMRFHPDLVIMEKGLKYDVTNHERVVVKEETIMNNLENEYTPAHRSIALAAYVFLCVAGGDQMGSDRILIFIGERHKDIFDYFDQLVLSSRKIPWVKKRKRTYLLLPSHVQ